MFPWRGSARCAALWQPEAVPSKAWNWLHRIDPQCATANDIMSGWSLTIWSPAINGFGVFLLVPLSTPQQKQGAIKNDQPPKCGFSVNSTVMSPFLLGVGEQAWRATWLPFGFPLEPQPTFGPIWASQKLACMAPPARSNSVFFGSNSLLRPLGGS